MLIPELFGAPRVGDGDPLAGSDQRATVAQLGQGL